MSHYVGYLVHFLMFSESVIQPHVVHRGESKIDAFILSEKIAVTKDYFHRFLPVLYMIQMTSN